MAGARVAHQLGGGVDGDAALRAARIRHPNAGLVDPLWVSEDCVGLTAIYAVVNGIRLALAHHHRFTAREVHHLMSAGLRFFEGRLNPAQCVMSGIRVQHWHGVVAAMSEATRFLSGARVIVERVPVECAGDRRVVFDALDEAVSRFRVPLMLLRGGMYTVVSGTTPTSILLFDSRGYSWISKRVCAVPGDSSHARHMICPPSLVALNV